VAGGRIRKGVKRKGPYLCDGRYAHLFNCTSEVLGEGEAEISRFRLYPHKKQTRRRGEPVLGVGRGEKESRLRIGGREKDTRWVTFDKRLRLRARGLNWYWGKMKGGEKPLTKVKPWVKKIPIPFEKRRRCRSSCQKRLRGEGAGVERECLNEVSVRSVATIGGQDMIRGGKGFFEETLQSGRVYF